MEIENTDSRDWDDTHGKKQNQNCVINIFCCDKKSDCDGDKKNNCVINIFCGGRKSDGICTDETQDTPW